jgi:hypothetical protein
VPQAVAALAAQRQLGVRTERIEESLNRLGITRSGKSRLSAFALTDPYRIDPREASRADRVNRRHVDATTVANQFLRACRLGSCLRLRDALFEATAPFGLSHRVPSLSAKAHGIAVRTCRAELLATTHQLAAKA